LQYKFETIYNRPFYGFFIFVKTNSMRGNSEGIQLAFGSNLVAQIGYNKVNKPFSLRAS
jgi:hypothetical protein